MLLLLITRYQVYQLRNTLLGWMVGVAALWYGSSSEQHGHIKYWGEGLPFSKTPKACSLDSVVEVLEQVFECP